MSSPFLSSSLFPVFNGIMTKNNTDNDNGKGNSYIMDFNLVQFKYNTIYYYFRIVMFLYNIVVEVVAIAVEEETNCTIDYQ